MTVASEQLGYRYGRKGLRRIWLHESIPHHTLQALLESGGQTIKTSAKGTVRHKLGGVIKESRGGLAGLLRHTFQPARYRRAWEASKHLLEFGVGIPPTIAYVEWGILGVTWKNALITEYLDGWRDVEAFLQALVQRGAGQDTITGFLTALAADVNRLCGCGAYHADLSGKNIFTEHGGEFFFVDLDAVALVEEYTEEMRLKNHIQLYDSFCDTLNDSMLVPFITAMLPPGIDPRVWMPQVRKGQEARRLRYNRRLEKQGLA